MDGPWQIGHVPAKEYGLKAADAARQMRDVDAGLKLVACGSSGPGMPTYLEWDREVLEQCYEYVDALSLHRYFTNTAEETGNDSGKFLALNLSMDKQIEETLAVCDMVQGRKRSPKKLWLSFDEWNVWYRERSAESMNGHRHEAPHLLEEIYNLEDALLVGGLLNSLMRHADRVKIACLAQLVNVIAPIMTNANGMFLQTIAYPYSWALQYARGSVLDVLVESPSTYEVAGMGQVAHLDVTGSFNKDDGKIALFLLNRDLSKPHQVEINWGGAASARSMASLVLTGDDLKAVNSFDAPRKVVPQAGEKTSTSGGRTILELPPRSYSMFQWGT
jgi:alpha-N-arabinofuranosidase